MHSARSSELELLTYTPKGSLSAKYSWFIFSGILGSFLVVFMVVHF